MFTRNAQRLARLPPRGTSAEKGNAVAEEARKCRNFPPGPRYAVFFFFSFTLPVDRNLRN